MVNRTRTLLLNLGPWVGTDRPPGEEYVPATYAPRHLPPDLAAARVALFGPGADRAGMNLTLARLLAYLHASPFHADVTAADDRITYDPAHPVAVFDRLGPRADGPAYVGWNGVRGFSAAGRGYGAWTVTTDGAGGYSVVPTGGAPESGAVTELDSGDRVPLPGSSLHLVVPSDAAGTWAVTLLVRPAHTFVRLADLPNASTLFRPTGSGSDPVWYRAWSSERPPADRAAAAALALAARTEELGS